MSDIAQLEDDLRVASKILEWEFGDIWGHVGARVPGEEAIALKLFRPLSEQQDDWLVHFDYSLKTLAGVGTAPMEARIYTEIFRRRPDVGAAIHSHAPMCVAMSLAGATVGGGHMQADRFGLGLPVYPKTIFIVDENEGRDLADNMGPAPAILIKGHGIVVVGKDVDEATVNAIHLERAAKVQVFARLLGYTGTNEETLAMMRESMEKLQAQSRALGSQRFTDGHSAEWNYYAGKARKGEPWNRGWT